jgi:hypothetical protein
MDHLPEGRSEAGAAGGEQLRRLPELRADIRVRFPSDEARGGNPEGAVILNGRTADPSRARAKRRGRRPAMAPKMMCGGIRPNPGGSFEERCAWMRERQRKRREEKRR